MKSNWIRDQNGFAVNTDHFLKVFTIWETTELETTSWYAVYAQLVNGDDLILHASATEEEAEQWIKDNIGV